MNPIELAASNSRLATVNVGEKALLFLGLLFLAISLPPRALLPIGLCVLGVAVWARVPVRLYATLIAAPTAFLLLGLWPLVFALTEDGITYLGWHNAAYVLARSVIGMAATMLFALTTPLAEILGALRFLPDTIVQLISLIYRFVGALMVTAKSMWEAQHARLGYRTFGRAVNSAASQASSLFCSHLFAPAPSKKDWNFAVIPPGSILCIPRVRFAGTWSPRPWHCLP